MADTDTAVDPSCDTSNEDIIAQRILKRAEIAKMTRQLKNKLSKAGMKVRDQNTGTNSANSLQEGIKILQHPHRMQQSSSGMSSPMSSPSKSLSEDVTNNITATAISNIQKSKLITPTRNTFNLSMSQITPSTGSPLKRKNSSITRSATSNRSRTFYDEDDDETDSLVSPLKRHHSSFSYGVAPYNNSSTSPFQLKQSAASIPTSAPSASMQPPKTPPQKQEELFQPFSSQGRNRRRDSFSRQKENQMPWNEQQNVLFTPKSSNKVKEFTTPNGSKYSNQQEELGADLLMFLSNSPARTFSSKDQKDYNRLLTIPTTPKSSSHNTNNNQLESTPLRNTPGASFMQQPLLGTPIGISMLSTQMTPNNRNSKPVGLNKTPFSLSDYINLTPSPRLLRTPNAAAAESSLHQALFKH